LIIDLLIFLEGIQLNKIRSIILIAMIALLFCAGLAGAHRMMMGYRVNDVQVTALYDDGTPAGGATIDVMSDGKSIARGVTDGRGIYDFRPENHSGDIEFIASSAGHRTELSLDLEQKKQTDEISLPMRVASGLGYLLGLSGLAMIYVSRRAQKTSRRG